MSRLRTEYEAMNNIYSNIVYEEIEVLKRGFYTQYAEFPEKDSITLLFEDLKDNGFIPVDTHISHFRVFFGIPLSKEHTPFIPIRWLKNQQLFRCFIYSLIPEEKRSYTVHHIAQQLFQNKWGKTMFIPNSDKKRLMMSSDYDTLQSILKKYKMRYK